LFADFTKCKVMEGGKSISAQMAAGAKLRVVSIKQLKGRFKSLK
jgi:hypothetical protein